MFNHSTSICQCGVVNHIFKLICVSVLISSKDTLPTPPDWLLPPCFLPCVFIWLNMIFLFLCVCSLNTDNTNSYSECYVQWYVQPPPRSPLFFALEVCFCIQSFHLQPLIMLMLVDKTPVCGHNLSAVLWHFWKYRHFFFHAVKMYQTVSLA